MYKKKHTKEQYLYCIKNLFAVFFFVDVAFGDSLGAFHLGKNPGNFGGSKSGISGW